MKTWISGNVCLDLVISKDSKLHYDYLLQGKRKRKRTMRKKRKVMMMRTRIMKTKMLMTTVKMNQTTKVTNIQTFWRRVRVRTRLLRKR